MLKEMIGTFEFIGVHFKGMKDQASERVLLVEPILNSGNLLLRFFRSARYDT